MHVCKIFTHNIIFQSYFYGDSGVPELKQKPLMIGSKNYLEEIIVIFLHPKESFADFQATDHIMFIYTAGFGDLSNIWKHTSLCPAS